jgi:precorrin-6B C5,15-methyltransferase / cobalt-precorrin-6B C5,C15-methyltransferase
MGPVSLSDTAKSLPPVPPMPQLAAAQRWLSIVGIGEDGIDGLAPVARELVRGAAVVFGGSRHLALAAALISGTARPWRSPFDAAVAEVLAERGRQVCVLASGDPFWHGVGAVLARHVDVGECVTVPAPSAFSLAAARLGWPVAETATISLHGRALDLVRPHLQPGARVLALTSGRADPAALGRLLTATGFGASRLIVLEALGGARERIRDATAAVADCGFGDVDNLNVVGIEVAAEPGARIIARAAGLADDLFEHDGQITKREIRAVTLSALAPRRGELLWDIGAGAGSVAIEWMLADPRMRAVAIERRPDRAARIARNAALCGVPGLTIVIGEAPAALHGLAPPDAIFIGGGADANLLDHAMAALGCGGRLVVNAVTLATEALLIGRHATLGGDLIRIAITRAEPVGVARAVPENSRVLPPPQPSPASGGGSLSTVPSRANEGGSSLALPVTATGGGSSFALRTGSRTPSPACRGGVGRGPAGWRPALPVTQWNWTKP